MKAELRLSAAALLGGLPAVAVALVATFRSPLVPAFQIIVALAILAGWLAGAALMRQWVVFKLRTISNLLAAVREGDYSFRVRGGRRDDAFGELVLELNGLAQTLQGERFGGVESAALLGKVMAEIDVVVLAFDPHDRLCLANPAGLRLLGKSSETPTGRSAAELGLEECLRGAAARTLVLPFRPPGERWELRRGSYRQEGRPHQLLVLSDVSRALRAEELEAFKRLVRVLGHELNNSLTPIKSIAGSLEALVAREDLPADWREDVQSGLRVIGSRADALNRLMSAWAQLARLPQPSLSRVVVASWVGRTVALETRLPVEVSPGPELALAGDGDQLDQLLINLVRNAVDAALQTAGGVRLGWEARGRVMEMWLEDDGPGLPPSANLFVPFFTTKAGGSGIGLALVRQIAEAHGGSITLTNRAAARGCRAVLRLPLAAPAAAP